jgi:hypothetical protein
VNRLQYAALGAVTVLGFVGGLALGWVVWASKPTTEGPAPAVHQPDASVVLQRDPTPPPPAPHVIPKGSREERRISVTIQPAEPGPVSVDLSLVRLDDGSARVVASSHSGELIDGMDVPIRTPVSAEPVRLWAAGVTYAGDRAWGVLVHRDIWRFRVGLEINATRDTGAEARLVAGWTW